MNFGQAISSVFKNYANFNGRARRSEFWFFELFNFIIYLAVSIIDYFVTGGSDTLSFVAILYWLYSLAILVPSLAVSWRRLHDIGMVYIHCSCLSRSSAGSSCWHGGQRTAIRVKTNLVRIPRGSTAKAGIK